ncbi:hypothetical protein [Luteimonas suaedae]|uniref:hypothetical protein n=1 Tax=Luteimonas suaedae TaxID=2605430 RepID=UPI0011EC8A85|nr:hypothetical protein [Luteimonas suaedae]
MIDYRLELAAAVQRHDRVCNDLFFERHHGTPGNAAMVAWLEQTQRASEARVQSVLKILRTVDPVFVTEWEREQALSDLTPGRSS